MKEKTSKRAGVIDIGSSSIKLTIGEAREDDIKILESLKNSVPIGNDTFFKGRISQEIINQTVVVLEKYKQILKEYEISEVLVTATTAVREARNKDIFLDTVLRKTGINIEVITVGDVVYYIDAYLSHKLKNTYPIHTKNLLIAELGAGGLDVSVMEKGFTLMNVGLPIGTLRFKQLISGLGGSRGENIEAIEESFENEFQYLKRSLPKITVDDIVFIAENYSYYLPNLLSAKRQSESFFKLGAEESRDIYSGLMDKNPEEIKAGYKIPIEIAETITGYAIILNMLFKLTENKHIYILETSLSEAMLANVLLDFELSQKYNKTNQLISVATFLCQKYNLDLSHLQHVAKMSEVIFDGLKENLGLKKKDFLYLILASYLHDIGMFIHNRAHHKHTEYIISSLNLFRLTDEEIKIISCIGRYHRKAPPMDSHLIYTSLHPEKQILVQKLSAILRIANSLDRSHKQKIEKLEIKLNSSGDVTLIACTQKSLILEKSDFLDKKDLFEEITGNKASLVLKS